MFTHVLDHAGNTVFAKDLAANPKVFLDEMAPFRPGLVVGCECMFARYWLADLCEDESIPFSHTQGVCRGCPDAEPTPN